MKSTLTAAAVLFFISVIVFVPVRAQSQSFIATPAYIRAAYDVDPLLQAGYTAKGVTVAIVNSGIDSTFYSDMDAFSSMYGLPKPVISVVQPDGPTGTNEETPSGETTADAEFVHAMAPDAKLLMVLVGTGSLLDGFSYVVANNAADIATLSPSWAYWGAGASGIVQTYNNEYAKSVAEKITLIAASNDWGSNNTVPWGTFTGGFWTDYLPDSYLMPQYSPYVTAVGGTEFVTDSSTPYSEVGWSQSGGGPSNLFPEPAWQTGPGVPQNGFRNMPDIALDASCDTPYAYYWDGGPGSFCGTSAGAPTFAGIMADIEQAAGERLGWLNPTLYSLGSSDPSVYHDITSGCSLVEVGSSTSGVTQTGYCAQPGWDFVTGWGSIDATKLAKHFAPQASTISISLSAGWNLISLPLAPLSTKTNNVLSGLIAANDFTTVWAYQGGKWSYAALSNGALSGPLTTMQDGVGYWIYMTQVDNLTVGGYVIPPPPSSPQTYNLAAGWNLVGFKPQPTVQNETVGTYLSSLSGQYDPNSVWIYDNSNGSWIRADSTHMLQPGEAMWIFMTRSATLIP